MLGTIRKMENKGWEMRNCVEYGLTRVLFFYRTREILDLLLRFNVVLIF